MVCSEAAFTFQCCFLLSLEFFQSESDGGDNVIVFLFSKHSSLFQVEKYEKDEKIVHGTLTSMVKSHASEGRKDYFDTLHLSPIKVHFNVSSYIT